MCTNVNLVVYLTKPDISPDHIMTNTMHSDCPNISQHLTDLNRKILGHNAQTCPRLPSCTLIALPQYNKGHKTVHKLAAWIVINTPPRYLLILLIFITKCTY